MHSSICWSAITGLVFLMTACSGGSSSDSGPNVGPLTGPVSGTWALQERVTAASGICAGEVGDTDSYQITITQTGSDLTVTTPFATFTGTINGNRMTWNGSVTEPDGTTTITSSNLTAGDNSIAGSINWTFSNGVDTCAGTTEISATRVGTLRISPNFSTELSVSNPTIDGGEVRRLPEMR